MMLIQVLKFESEPHRAEEHALWKGFGHAMSYSYLMQILSLSLIAFGPTFKIFLEVLHRQEKEGSDDDNQYLTTALLIPPKTLAALFCWSLAAILLSLQLVKFSHSGPGKTWSLLTKTGQDGVEILHWPVIITDIFKMILLVFVVMLQYWTQKPEVLTLCGLAVVFAYTASRIFIFY